MQLPERWVEDHDPVDADHRQEPGAQLEREERHVADPAAPEERYLFQVLVVGCHAKVVLEYGVQIPLVQHAKVHDGQYCQVPHAGVLAHFFPDHYGEWGDVEDGADEEQE